ncbi:sugar phosphate isomerase/epimerase family protein [Paenibacillus eucommiae]|uniref:Sugar phosphate isomerase/epimerase n=1 Tax=Paenibacillus eucommiae TaxID=1355755 RepID=A0ABS4IX19_9BACL|nr:sugar phosphate isomerase/epimerase [Paenibacillus eucommiae]MBP1992137.1 hypothetical protein [Paenibacillus eucommiae]
MSNYVNNNGLSSKSLHAPRVEFQQSWWAMRGIGRNNREWSMEEKFEHIAAAGFTGILGRLPEPEQAGLWRRKLDEFRFGFGVEAFPESRGQFADFVRQAKDFGADYISAQVANSFVTGLDATSLLNGLMEEAALADIPFFVETHRGRITQDLLRTTEYVQQLPSLHLTIDLSHYVLTGEIWRDVENIDPWFEPLLERTACIHGRISNGQQIQVDIGAGVGVGADADHPMTTHFARWWEKAMRLWLAKAKAGDILPFVCELGPEPYAIPAIHQNRWEQSLVVQQLAQRIWNKVSGSDGQ